MKRVALTGAAGRIGTSLRPLLRPRDLARIEEPSEGSVALAFRGGGFCEINHDGNIRARNMDGLATSMETVP